jgi:hypothetical protein
MTTNPLERPVFLKVLCILSFIAIGFNGIFLISGVLSGPPEITELEEISAVLTQKANEMRTLGNPGFAHLIDQLNEMNFALNENFWTTSLLTGLGLIAGYMGVLWMWNGKKIGFHSYVIYNIISVFSVYAIVPADSIPLFQPITGVIISGIFIFMYSRNLYWMR